MCKANVDIRPVDEENINSTVRHGPNGEGEHALKVAIDLNGDSKPDYAEFSHHCKEESAPYPIDDAGRAAWDAKHGEVDWDYTCTNVYTIRDGSWTKQGRNTPM